MSWLLLVENELAGWRLCFIQVRMEAARRERGFDRAYRKVPYLAHVKREVIIHHSPYHLLKMSGYINHYARHIN